MFVLLWHKEAKANGLFTIKKTTRNALCIKYDWTIFTINSYHKSTNLEVHNIHNRIPFVKSLKDWFMGDCLPYAFITNLTFAVSCNLPVDRSYGPQQASSRV